jgi:hypothetical protein
MLPITYAQLIAGAGVGVIILAFMLKTPLLRDLLGAAAAATLTDLLLAKGPPQGAELVDRLAEDISGQPYFTLGLILTTIAAVTLFRAMRSQ